MIEAPFTFHPVYSDQGERYAAIRAEAKQFAEFIVKNTPESAEQTLALRKLQECVMYANAAIAIHEANDQNCVSNG
jgi:hypothetical protein